MFIAARFTIAKTWKQLRCPTRDEWIEKMRFIWTMEIYSAIKQKEAHSIPWVSLDNITLGESEGHERSHVI